MRRAALILFAIVAGTLVWAMISGTDARLAHWAAGHQREFQNALARTLRALRAGEPGALFAMAGICFSYGVVHAIGPGHGKVLVGGYGIGRRVPLLRLSIVAMISALGQAVTAIVLTGAGLLALGWSRERMTALAEDVMVPISAAAIGAIGLWLVWRGTRRIASRDQAHSECCGHAHGPTPEAVTEAGNGREVAALIAGIAIRPCSGALLLLVLSWHMDIWVAGMAGTIAMAFGTGLVTVAVAIVAVTAREGALATLTGGGARLFRILPAIELAAGCAIALVAIRMFQSG
ncbi:hypothetical protein [Palleronia sp. LCG004]|uniref:nickel/cobalt transporter n=1 Tax=Palleronia sp. LCG004 TaxID=3079304 RepID=UPI002943D5C6|nr:hypothetical protein [Palleronia sp. LCG004]WOI57199.1 hypothetical protein RVY76_05260 [Palleronia sp. LCG004]